MAFNPILDQQVSPLTPQEGVNTTSALAGIVSSAFQGLASTKSEGPSTLEERASVAWQKYTKQIGKEGLMVGEANMEELQGFGRWKPEFNSWSRDQYTEQNTPLDPTQAALEEAQRSALAAREEAWAKSPDAITSMNAAANLYPDDPNKRQSYVESARAAYEARQAGYARLAEEAKAVDDTNKLSDSYWEREAPNMLPRITNGTQMLNTLYQAMARNPNMSFDLAREMPEVYSLMPGLIGFSVINRDNIGMFAGAFKQEIIAMTQRDAAAAGITLNKPSEQWMKSYFSTMDGLISDITKGMTPEEINKRWNAETTLAINDYAATNGLAIERNEALRLNSSFAGSLTPNGVAALNSQLAANARENTTSIIVAGQNASIDSNKAAQTYFMAALSGVYTDPLLTPEEANKMIEKDVLALCVNHTEASTNGGKSSPTMRFSADAYTTCFGKNSQIIKSAAADPEYRNAVVSTLKPDLAIDVDALRKAAMDKGFNLSIDNSGKLQFTFGQTTGEAKGPLSGLVTGGGVEPSNDQRTSQFMADNADLIKEVETKFFVLSQLGDIGSDVTLGFIDQQPLAEQGGNFFSVTTGNAPSGTNVIKVGGASVASNSAMNPLFSMEGASTMTRSGADVRMRTVIEGPFQEMQRNFGSALTINDAIAKSGTSREKETTGSRHFHGDALDISTAGMTDQQKINLVQAALKAGFQGFGFGENILHVDLGNKRSWFYGNSTFGGMDKASLDAILAGSTVAAPTLPSYAQQQPQGTSVEPSTMPEYDDGEGAPSNFSLNLPTPSVAPTASPSAAPAEMPKDIPAPQAPAKQETANTPAPVSKEGQALVQALTEKPDITFGSKEEFEQAVQMGDVSAGDIVEVKGEVFFIKKDGSYRRIK